MTTTNAARSDQPGTAKPGTAIPEFVTIVAPAPHTALHFVASTLVGLLAENPDLPVPVLASISPRPREIDLQFPNSPDTYHAMAAWADRFGGTLTGEPRTDRDGACVRCEVRFDRHGVQFRTYAYITTADTATS